jgi:hypothetical protein
MPAEANKRRRGKTARPLNPKPPPAEALAKEGKYQSKVKGKKVKG